MNNTQTRAQKAGWAILLVIGGLLMLNGATWFRSGPEVTLAYPLEQEGVPVGEFTREHPVFVEHIGFNAREIAIWYTAFGLMAVIVALEGFRRGTRWAWLAACAIPTAFIIAGVSYGIWQGLGFVNAGRVFIGLVALAGLFLARPRPQKSATAHRPALSPEPDTSSMMG